MNERINPNTNRPANEAPRLDDRIVDTVTGAPIGTTSRPGQSPLGMAPAADLPVSRGVMGYWPVLIVLLAGVVLALLVWMPAENAATTPDTAVQPAANGETTTPPAVSTTPPAGDTTAPAGTTTAPAGNTTVTPATPTPVTPQTNGTAPQN